MKNSIGTRNSTNTASDPHFRFFAKSLEETIARYGDLSEENLLDRQKRQVETLVDLEDQFRLALLKHPWGAGIYESFMTFICDEKRNILSARPYFRERQTLFTPKMIPVFKRRHAGGLHRFHFNHNFIRFVMTRRNWSEAPNKPLTKKILSLNQKIVDLRSEIATMNLPLAISRSRIFYSWTPQSHLSHMDLVQISAEGLLAAIDKFCLPFSRVFRSVCIGRITGDFIENYNQTSLHFWPQDKRKIYKAAKLRARQTGPIDFEELANKINAEQAEVTGETPGGEDRVPIVTDASEISRLLMATALVSADAKPRNNQDEDMPSIVESVASDESLRPDVRVEASEAHHVLQAAISELPMRQQKLFRMKGI